MGISNVMALRGDSIVGEKRFTPVPGGYRYASELVAAIRRFDDFFSIGVGGYPEKHFEAPNIETDIANLKKKGGRRSRLRDNADVLRQQRVLQIRRQMPQGGHNRAHNTGTEATVYRKAA